MSKLGFKRNTNSRYVLSQQENEIACRTDKEKQPNCLVGRIAATEPGECLLQLGSQTRCVLRP